MTVSSYAGKYNIFPVTDPISFEFYLKQSAQMWPAKEIRISMDKEQFLTLSPRYQELVYDILAFFAPGDGLVSQQILGFINKTENFGQQAMLFWQGAIEIVHAHAYSDAIQTLCPRKKRREVFNAVDKLPCVRAKADFISEYMGSDKYPLSVKYLAGAISEGIFFVSLFSIVFYLKDKNLLDRFCFLNTQVSKDEFLHRNFNIMMAYKLGIEDCLASGRPVELTEDIVREMLTKAIEIERAHIGYILRTPIDSVEIDETEGMTIENNMRYVATLADQIAIGLKYNPMFTVHESVVLAEGDTRVYEIALKWMAKASWMNKTNFYEGDPDSYTSASLKDMIDEFYRMMKISDEGSDSDSEAEGQRERRGDEGNDRAKIAEAFANPCDVDI